MRNLLKSSTILILIFGLGCRKDTPIPELEKPVSGCTEEWCYDFPEPEGGFGFGYQYFSEGTQYIAPCFNPNNSNEFIYLRRGTNVNAELLKHDITIGQDQLLCNSVPIATAPQWGKNGWIVFSTTDWHIYKIKENGADLTQMTFGVNDQYPTFNFNSDKIIYPRLKDYSNFELSQNPSLYGEYKMIIMDINGTVIDSVMASNVIPGNYFQTWNLGYPDSSDTYFFIGGTSTGIGIYQWFSNSDSTNNIPVKLLYSQKGKVTDLEIQGNKLYYTMYKNGIYQLDLGTGNHSKIKFACDTRYYTHFSISNDGSKILLGRVNAEIVDDYLVKEQSEVWCYDMTACEQYKILGN